MKIKLSLSLLFLLLFADFSYATVSASYTLRFCLGDYSIDNEDSDSLFVGRINGDAFYSEVNPYALPLETHSIAFPNYEKKTRVGVTVFKRIIKSGISISKRPFVFTINAFGHCLESEAIIEYDQDVYPDSICSLSSIKTFDDFTIFNFIVSPFEYNKSNRILYFVDSIKVDFKLDKFGPDLNSAYKKGTYKATDQILRLVDNYNDIKKNEEVESTSYEPSIDYLIITSEKLKSAFEPLIDWKRMKGLRSEIMTVEDVKTQYKMPTAQLSIKKCIADLFHKKGLRYVLLAGDTCHVPPAYIEGTLIYAKRDSSGKVITKHDYIPCDLYYSCFDGDFDWDLDKDGIRKWNCDNFDLYSYVALTRLPSIEISDAEIIVNKILEFEKFPVWNNSMLIAGNRLGKNPNIPDAQWQGELLYESSIKPYWNGKNHYFFDSYTDFEGGSNYDISYDHLQSKLKDGYSFVSMLTHGGPTAWNMEGTYYKVDYIKDLVNCGHTIITTMACSTNAFDRSHPDSISQDYCLSEAFIRNLDTGVVAYLGCSREGFYSTSRTVLGPSLDYESRFYRHLFSNDLNTNSFGELVAQAKRDLITVCDGSNANYRLIMFGLNPIGDPEMPVYTKVPEAVPMPDIVVQNNKLEISTLTSDSLFLCLSKNEPNREIIMMDSINLTIPLQLLSPEMTLCVMGHNQIPKIMRILFLNEGPIPLVSDYEADLIIFGVDSQQKTKPFIMDGRHMIHGKTIILNSDFSISEYSDVQLTN